MYPDDGFVKNTWNDLVEYPMFLDALNFSNNSLVRLPDEFINSYKGETIVTAPIAKGLANTSTDLRKQNLTNFLLVIQFAVDSTHMES
jgi:hypothetical protein